MTMYSVSAPPHIEPLPPPKNEIPGYDPWQLQQVPPSHDAFSPLFAVSWSLPRDPDRGVTLWSRQEFLNLVGTATWCWRNLYREEYKQGCRRYFDVTQRCQLCVYLISFSRCSVDCSAGSAPVLHERWKKYFKGTCIMVWPSSCYINYLSITKCQQFVLSSL